MTENGLAPSGSAASNMKGFTLHFFLRLDDQYQDVVVEVVVVGVIVVVVGISLI